MFPDEQRNASERERESVSQKKGSRPLFLFTKEVSEGSAVYTLGADTYTGEKEKERMRKIFSFSFLFYRSSCIYFKGMHAYVYMHLKYSTVGP